MWHKEESKIAGRQLKIQAERVLFQKQKIDGDLKKTVNTQRISLLPVFQMVLCPDWSSDCKHEKCHAWQPVCSRLCWGFPAQLFALTRCWNTWLNTVPLLLFLGTGKKNRKDSQLKIAPFLSGTAVETASWLTLRLCIPTNQHYIIRQYGRDKIIWRKDFFGPLWSDLWMLNYTRLCNSTRKFNWIQFIRGHVAVNLAKE